MRGGRVVLITWLCRGCMPNCESIMWNSCGNVFAHNIVSKVGAKLVAQKHICCSVRSQLLQLLTTDELVKWDKLKKPQTMPLDSMIGTVGSNWIIDDGLRYGLLLPWNSTHLFFHFPVSTANTHLQKLTYPYISQCGKRTIVFKHTRMVTFVLGPTGPIARSKIVWAMAKLEVKLQKLVSKVDTSA